MQMIQRAMMNQDLIVAVEHFRTPTAQLADYILPGDAWLERNCLSDAFGWTAFYRSSQKVVEPLGECRGVYHFWRELAIRMGLGEQFPWATNEDVLDHRLQRMGMTFETFAEKHSYHLHKPRYRKYEQTGFDPLPY